MKKIAILILTVFCSAPAMAEYVPISEKCAKAAESSEKLRDFLLEIQNNVNIYDLDEASYYNDGSGYGFETAKRVVRAICLYYVGGLKPSLPTIFDASTTDKEDGLR